MHRINLRGPWRADRGAAGYTLLRKFHAPPGLDAARERVRLCVQLSPEPTPLRAELNGGELPLAFEGQAVAGAAGVLGRCDISAILAAYNSLVLFWSEADAAAAPLPQGELKLSPAHPHPLLLDAWLEIDER